MSELELCSFCPVQCKLYPLVNRAQEGWAMGNRELSLKIDQAKSEDEEIALAEQKNSLRAAFDKFKADTRKEVISRGCRNSQLKKYFGL